MGKTRAPNLGTGVVDWSAVPFYVVGATTGSVLREMPTSPFTPFSQNIIGEGSGTGEALAELTNGGHDRDTRFCRVATIGPTTVTRVEKCGVKVHAVPRRPTPEALGEALLEPV